jgi:hypothetical protein
MAIELNFNSKYSGTESHYQSKRFRFVPGRNAITPCLCKFFRKRSPVVMAVLGQPVGTGVAWTVATLLT